MGAGGGEEHNCMDHSQVQVRVRIIDRDAGALGANQEEEREPADRHKHKKERITPGDFRENRSQRIVPGDDCEAAYGEKENRLGKYCKARFSACAHSFEAAGDVKRSENLEKSPERKQVGEKDDVTWKRNGSRPSQRKKQGREGYGAPNQYRCHAGNESSTCPVNGSFACKPHHLAVTPPHTRTEPPR